MGWRVRKRIKIAKGLYINVGKTGVSASVGVRGATVNVSKRGTRATAGLPGSGISYSAALTRPAATGKAAHAAPPASQFAAGRLKAVSVVILLLLLVTPAWPFALIAGLIWLAITLWARPEVRARVQQELQKKNQMQPDDVLMSDVYARITAEKPRLLPEVPAIVVGEVPTESSLPERDNWETGQLAGRPDELTLDAELHIRYCDGAGQPSSRNITLRSVVPWGNDDIAMLAFCHERDEHRTFLASRVTEAVLSDSGEIIPDIGHWLRGKMTSTAEGRIAQAMHGAEDECLILAYIARADGAMRAKERALIAEFVADSSRAAGVDTADEAEIDRRVRSIACSYDAFRDAVKRLQSAPAHRRHEVVSVARAIIACEKRIDPAEQKAVDALAEMLA